VVGRFDRQGLINFGRGGGSGAQRWGKEGEKVEDIEGFAGNEEKGASVKEVRKKGGGDGKKVGRKVGPGE